jgi:hypothetical protein
MGDAQALDLQASNRSTKQVAVQIAAQLATAGLTAEANAFLNYAKNQQEDVETRTNGITVSA